jgi:hypothetical protein
MLTIQNTLLALLTLNPHLSAERERPTPAVRLRNELRWVADVGVVLLTVRTRRSRASQCNGIGDLFEESAYGTMAQDYEG